MNINIEVQYDKDQEGGSSDPLSFGEIEKLRESVNAPLWATIQMNEEAYGWEIRIHWNTDVRRR